MKGPTACCIIEDFCRRQIIFFSEKSCLEILSINQTKHEPLWDFFKAHQAINLAGSMKKNSALKLSDKTPVNE